MVSEMANLTSIETQPRVVEQLLKAAENERVSHAYLFDGERGSGKEEIAHYFAKRLFCEQSIKFVPCETCSSCLRMDSGNHPNFEVIRPDGQFIKKEQVNQLIQQFSKKSYEAGYKVYIITQTERLNTASANALLKYLEEPDGQVTALLLTDSYQAVLPTIRSRCQRLVFQEPPRERMIQHLHEKHGMTITMASAVTAITANEEEALTLAQTEFFSEMRKLIIKFVESTTIHINETLLLVQTEWMQVVKDRDATKVGLDLLMYAYRDLLAMKATIEGTRTYPDVQELFAQVATHKTYEQLTICLEAILQAKRQLQTNMNRTLIMEQLVLNMQEGLLVV